MLYKITALVDKPEIWAERVDNLVEEKNYFLYTRFGETSVMTCAKEYIVENPTVVKKWGRTVKIKNPYYDKYHASLLNGIYTFYEYVDMFPVYVMERERNEKSWKNW